MRVAVFTDNDFEKVNGVTTTLTALLAHAPGDIQPRIYTAAGSGSQTADYFALASVPVPIPFYREMRMYVPRWSAYLRQVLADRIDVLHLTTPGPMGLTALWIASKTGLPLVGSFHTDLQAYTTLLSGSPRLGEWMGVLMRWMYGRCHTVMVPSSATGAMLEQGGTPSGRIALWTRGVDTTHFSPVRRSPMLRASWGVNEEVPALLYVGRVSREKGLEMLPALCQTLRDRGVRHRLVIAGDGPLRPWLERQCPAAVFTGTLGRDAVADVFASADLFVFPSRTDTAGNVVLEAQASGLPVIVSDAGGPRENIALGRSGLVCEGGIGPWVRCVEQLLVNQQRRRDMADAARAYAMTRSWDAALSGLFDVYRAASRLTAPVGAAVHHAA